MTELAIKEKFGGEIDNETIVDGFREINRKWNENIFLAFDGVHLTASYSAAVTDGKIAHGLGWVPRDVIVLKEHPASTLTLNWDDFDDTYIYVTTSAACELRLFAGSYKEVIR